MKTPEGFVQVSRRRWIAWRAISGIEVSDFGDQVMLTVDRPGDSLTIYITEPGYARAFLAAVGLDAPPPAEPHL